MEGMNAPPSQVFGSHSFVTPLVISVIGIISAALVLLFYHYILSNFCFRSQRRLSTTILLSGHHQTERPERPLLTCTGLEKKILETIPILCYEINQSYLFRVDQTECVVCLGELVQGEMVRLLPDCKHAFHVPCIDQWFVAQNNCPICRSPLTEPVSKLLLPPSVDGITRNCYQHPAARPTDDRIGTNTATIAVDHCVNYGNCTASSSSSSGQRQSSSSSCSLRHCTSLALPVERKKSRKRRITGLKRSLSMDQSNSVFINIQSESSSGRDNNCPSTTTSSSPTATDDSVTRRLYGATSLKQSDRVSAKLLRSLSRWRNTEMLPY